MNIKKLYIRTVGHIFDKCGSSGQRVFQTVFDKSVRSRTCIIFVLSARICRRVLFSTNRNVLVFDKSGSFVFIYSVNYRAVFSCPVFDKTKQSSKLCFPDHTCVFPTAYKKPPDNRVTDWRIQSGKRRLPSVPALRP